jgi:hypothetical protein
MKRTSEPTLQDLINTILDLIPPPVQKIIVSYAVDRLPLGKFEVGVACAKWEIASSDRYVFLADYYDINVFSLDGNFKRIRNFSLEKESHMTFCMTATDKRLFIIFDTGLCDIDLTQPIETWQPAKRWYHWNGGDVKTNPEITGKPPTQNIFGGACKCIVIENTLLIHIRKYNELVGDWDSDILQ